MCVCVRALLELVAVQLELGVSCGQEDSVMQSPLQQCPGPLLNGCLLLLKHLTVAVKHLPQDNKGGDTIIAKRLSFPTKAFFFTLNYRNTVTTILQKRTGWCMFVRT